MLDKAAIEVVGVHAEYGPEAARKGVFQGMLYGSKRLAEGRTGIDPRFKQGALPSSPRAELRAHRGEWLVLLWYAHDDGEAVRGLVRVETEGDRLSRVQNYFFPATSFTSDESRYDAISCGVLYIRIQVAAVMGHDWSPA